MLLSQALSLGDTGGQPLPTAWPSLAERGADIRSAELTVLAGQPGSGKSAFALATAVRLGVPTLFFSADTAAWTAGVRLAAMVLNATQEDCERYMLEDPTWLDRSLEGFENIRWCFAGDPTLDIIDLELAAYEEIFGVSPELIVIDNLLDTADGEEEFASIRRTLKELRFLARDTGAAVLVLHHTSEAHNVGDMSAPGRNQIFGKDSRGGALVMTIAQHAGYMCIAVVKNRYGPFDPSGNTVDWFYFDGARMQIKDKQEMDR